MTKTQVNEIVRVLQYHIKALTEANSNTSKRLRVYNHRQGAIAGLELALGRLMPEPKDEYIGEGDVG